MARQTISAMNGQFRDTCEAMAAKFPQIDPKDIGKWAKFVVMVAATLRGAAERQGYDATPAQIEYTMKAVAEHVFGKAAPEAK